MYGGDDEDDVYGGFDQQGYVPLQSGFAYDNEDIFYAAPNPTSSYGAPTTSGGRQSASRRGVGSRMGTAAAAGGGEDRPMTSVRAAGYSSSGNRNANRQGLDPLGGGRGAAAPLQKPDRVSPEEQSKDMEKKVNVLIEESAMAGYENNLRAALDKAKEAGKLERSLCKYRESNGLSEQINPDLTYAVHLNLACQYHANKLFEDALATYSLIVRNKQYAQSGRLRVNMGNIYYEQKKYPSAIKMYRMALDQVPNTGKEIRFKIMRNIGNAFVKLGQFADAVQSYETIMEGLPDFRTGFNLVVCYYALGDKEKMKRSFEKLVSIRALGGDDEEDEITGTDDEFLHDEALKREIRARQRLANKFVLNASKLIAPVIEKDYVSGVDYIIECLRSTAFQSVINELEISKASQFLRSKKFDKAIEQLKQFEKRDASLAGIASTNLAFLYYLEGDYKNSEKYADSSLQFDSYNAKALVNKGNIHFQRAEYEKAKEFYFEAVKAEADCIEGLFNLGLSYKKLGKYNEATERFEKLIALLPSHPEVLFQLADISEAIGNIKAASEYFRQLATVLPTDPGVLARLANIYVKEDDESEAYHYNTDAYKLYPVNMEVIQWLGAYYVKNEVYEKAIHYFEQAALIQTLDPRWRLMVASCYRRMGSYQQALETYQQIHERFPENVECLKYLMAICNDLGMKDEVHEYVARLKKAERAAEAKAQAAAQRKTDRKSRKKKDESEAPQDIFDERNYGMSSVRNPEPEPEPAPAPASQFPDTNIALNVSGAIAEDKPKAHAKIKQSLDEDDFGSADLGDDLLPGM